VHVLVISDTHLSDAARLPRVVFDAAARADHIVHAGDHSVLEVVRVLERFAPVTAVRGNIEDAETFHALPETATVELDGVRIGVVHDAGRREGREARLAQLLPDCIVRVYGHSHMPEAARQADGSWVLNPGSPTQRRRSPQHTVGWLEVAAGEVVSAELIAID
jgi:putative phosphoesterase